MAIDKKQAGFHAKPTAGSLASAANIFNFLAHQGLILRRLNFEISTATVSTGNIVITVYKRPTPGSTTGQTALGTLSIPTGATVGQVYWKDVQGVRFQPGEELAYDVTTAAAGGSAAGAGFPINELVEESPDEATNWTNFVASS